MKDVREIVMPSIVSTFRVVRVFRGWNLNLAMSGQVEFKEFETQRAQRDFLCGLCSALKKQWQPAMTEIKFIQRKDAKSLGREELQLKFSATLRPGALALKKQR